MLRALAVSSVPRHATRVRQRFTRQVCTAHFASKVRIAVCIWILGRRQREYREWLSLAVLSDGERCGLTEERFRVYFRNARNYRQPIARMMQNEKYRNGRRFLILLKDRKKDKEWIHRTFVVSLERCNEIRFADGNRRSRIDQWQESGADADLTSRGNVPDQE